MQIVALVALAFKHFKRELLEILTHLKCKKLPHLWRSITMMIHMKIWRRPGTWYIACRKLFYPQHKPGTFWINLKHFKNLRPAISLFLPFLLLPLLFPHSILSLSFPLLAQRTLFIAELRIISNVVVVVISTVSSMMTTLTLLLG